METNKNTKISKNSMNDDDLLENIGFDTECYSENVTCEDDLPDATKTIDNTPVDDYDLGNFINSRCKFNASIRENISWSQSDIALIELYNMHRVSGVPISLFDKTITWLKRNISKLIQPNSQSLNHLPSRSTFMKRMYKKIYGEKHVKNVSPKVVNVSLSLRDHGMTNTQVTIFDIKEVLTCMLSNNDIMNPKNLLFFDPIIHLYITLQIQI